MIELEIEKKSNEGIIPPHFQAVITKDISGNYLAFIPSLCQIFRLDYNDLPRKLMENEEYYLTHSSNIPLIQEEINKEIKTKGLDQFYRVHPSGIAIVITQSCNLHCSYCLAKQGSYGIESHLMNINHIKRQLRVLFEKNPNLSFVKYFGGEPTLRFDLIEKICDFIYYDLGRKNISYAITTNGTLDAKKHIEIYKKYRFSVGISIDGTKEIHDQVRVDNNHNGSYEKAMKYCKELKNNNFPFAVIGVFDQRHLKYNLSYLDTIKFLNRISPLVKVQLLEALGDGRSIQNQAELIPYVSETKNQVSEAVDFIFKHITTNWIKIDENGWIYDNNIMRFIHGIVSGTATPYKNMCTASNLITLFPKGNIVSCYTFSGNQNLILGDSIEKYDEIEKEQLKFKNLFSWDSFYENGISIPWYRGIVGDICISDLLDSKDKYLNSSGFYNMFQEASTLRVIQNISAIVDDKMRLAKLYNAINEHLRLTGQFLLTEE